MKSAINPKNSEIKLIENEFIVSKTDIQSNIVYMNRVFMRISGYSEKELLGKPQNVIRHPDMPRGVFKLLWDEIKAGNEFLGYVKNLCKDGSYYWVLAHITSDLGKKGKVIGYYSVRRCPTRKGVEVMTDIYQKMSAIEQQHPEDRNCDKSIALLNSYAAEQSLTYFQLIQRLESVEDGIK